MFEGIGSAKFDAHAVKQPYECVCVRASYLIKCTDEENNLRERNRPKDRHSTDSDPKPRTDLYSVFLYISTHNSSQDELLSGNEPNKCI